MTTPRGHGPEASREQRPHEDAAWVLREQALARIQGVQTGVDVSKGRALEVATDRAARQAVEKLTEDANSELKTAREILRHEHRHRRRMGEHVLAANTHIDMAHNLMLRMATLDDVQAAVPGVLAFVRQQLPLADERRKRVEKFAKQGGTFGEQERWVLTSVLTAAQRSLQQQRMRARSFDRTLTVVVWGLAALAVAVAVAGALWPRFVPLCFTPENQVVCPTRMESAQGDRAVGPDHRLGHHLRVRPATLHPARGRAGARRSQCIRIVDSPPDCDPPPKRSRATAP